MKPEESEILSDIGRDPGYRVPDGYFERFAVEMPERLPNVEITDTDTRPTLWVRVRPYLYMAAAFAGVWCMMNVFNHFTAPLNHQQRFTEIARGIADEHNADDLIMNGVVSDYDIITYQDSVMADESAPMP